jgi:putative addiction module component (TIGR02574 family)
LPTEIPHDDAEKFALTPAKEAELDRRIATADADLAESVSWEDFRAELLACLE